MDVFDPEHHQDPVRALVTEVRGLPIGRSLSLANGAVIKSVAMRHGATHVRKFAVTSDGRGKDTPFRTAEEAAKAAMQRR